MLEVINKRIVCLGQICLANLSSDSEHQTKKYKLRITRDEYHTNSRELNLIKHEISYESDWFEIKDEQGSPFYREQSTLCLYASNKCWIDLKLYPNMKSARLKCIYLTMSNEIVKHSSRRRAAAAAKTKSASSSTTTANNPSSSDLNDSQDNDVDTASHVWTRVLSIRSKFVVRNRSAYDLKAKIVNSHTTMSENRVHRFLDTEAKQLIRRDVYEPIDMILNLDNFYLKDRESSETNSEYDALKVIFILNILLFIIFQKLHSLILFNSAICNSAIQQSVYFAEYVLFYYSISYFSGYFSVFC